MIRAAPVGWLLIVVGFVAVLPEIFTPRPVPGVIGCGLILALLGACIVCDHIEPKGGRDRGQ